MSSLETSAPLTVFLLEDNEGDVLLTQEALKQNAIPYQLLTCCNGEEAVVKLSQLGKQQIPFIILLDINVPRKNGLDVLQYIRQNPVLKFVPAFMLTTSSDPADIERAYHEGATGYLNKPVEWDSFTQMIQQLLTFWKQFVVPPYPAQPSVLQKHPFANG